jgi:hypothetical protein
MNEVKDSSRLSFGECVIQLKRGVSADLVASLRYHVAIDAKSLVRAVCVGSDVEGLKVLLEDPVCGVPCASSLAASFGEWDKETRLATVTVLGALVDKVLSLADAAKSATEKQKRILDEESCSVDPPPQSVRLFCELLWPKVASTLLQSLSEDGTVLDFAVSDCFLSISVVASLCQAEEISPAVGVVLRRLLAWYSKVRGADLICVAVAQLLRHKWFCVRPDLWSRCVGFLARKSVHLERSAKALVKGQLNWLVCRKAVPSIQVGLILLCLLVGRLGPKRRRKALTSSTAFRSVVLEHLPVAPSCVIALMVEEAEQPVRNVVLEHLLESELPSHSPDNPEDGIWLDVCRQHADAVEAIAKRNGLVLTWFWAVASAHTGKILVLLDLLKANTLAQAELSCKREFWKRCFVEPTEVWTSSIVPLSDAKWDVFSAALFEEMMARPGETHLVSIASCAASRLSVGVLAPLLAHRMQHQQELTLELLDDESSSPVVRQLLFDRLVPLLLIRVLPSLASYSDLFAPLLLRRMRALCEFDQCRRLAAEAMGSKISVAVAVPVTVAEFDSVMANLDPGEERSSAIKAILFSWSCMLVSGRLDSLFVASLCSRSLDASQLGDDFCFLLMKSPVQKNAMQVFLERPTEMTGMLIRFFAKFKSECAVEAFGVMDFLIELQNPTKER